ncbi:hypothetical protein VTO42DRAFT_2211 [Malbranchea cinnamomea]
MGFMIVVLGLVAPEDGFLARTGCQEAPDFLVGTFPAPTVKTLPAQMQTFRHWAGASFRLSEGGSCWSVL